MTQTKICASYAFHEGKMWAYDHANATLVEFRERCRSYREAWGEQAERWFHRGAMDHFGFGHFASFFQTKIRG